MDEPSTLSMRRPSRDGIRYDFERHRLVVTFTGRVYEYIDVPPNVARAFHSAFSKGTYFNAYIRDRYDHRELTREQM